MEHPNLVCPSCNRQFQKSDLVSVQPTNFAKLTQTISCPGCSEDINPEDATLEYLDQIASNQVLGHALTVGGFVNIATKEIEIGKTEEYTIEPDSDYEISLALQDETDKPPGLDIDQLSGEQFKWHDGHLLIDDSVVVDLVPVNDSDVGFISSELNKQSKHKVTVAHNIQSRLSRVEQPPWADLLEEAAAVFYRGRGIAEYPLVFSAFENFLGREIARTLLSQGKSRTYVEKYLEEDHTNMYDRFNKVLDNIAGHKFEDYDNATYTKLDNFWKERNDRIIHVDPSDRAAKLGPQDMKDCFSTIIEAMLTIHKICYQERS
jgi:hypothetical protein